MTPAGNAVRRAILEGMARDQRTAEPMNAMVIWTELARGLCGTLDRKGAEIERLGGVVDRWCRDRGAMEVDLDRWAYRVEPERRLDAAALGAALQRIQLDIERTVQPVVDASGGEGEGDGGRAAFMAVVDGWFPAGLAILRSFPAASRAPAGQVLGALRAWCARFLPRSEAGPAELGVRVVRE
jgi:hypothetical protein